MPTILIDTTKIALNIDPTKGSKGIAHGRIMTLDKKLATKRADQEIITTIMTQDLMKRVRIGMAKLDFQDVLPANTVALQAKAT